MNIVKDTKFYDSITKLDNGGAEELELIIEHISNKKFIDLYDTNIYPHKLQKIQDSFKFIEYISSQNESYCINDEVKISDKADLLLVLAPWIDIEFLSENKISFNALSYGQKFLIKFLYSILNQLNNLDAYKNYTDIIFLLDEVELGLHPQWQKEYIALLVNVLNEYIPRFKFNIVCSSHSPFILSDLLKENVIFLDKYKKDDIEVQNGIQKLGNCKNVSKETEINPFGANIHTLLSHGFFMKDGLMGEFAKSKIDEVIKYLKPDEQSIIQDDKEAKSIIDIIGEPMLKKTLQTMYEAKIYKDESKLDILKRKQKEIEEAIEQEELKNESDKSDEKN